MVNKILIALTALSLTACGMSNESQDFLQKLGKASACLTLEGCEGQRRYQQNNSGTNHNSETYQSAITIRGTQICPLDLNLGSLSHQTSKGLNTICYYN